MAYTRRQWQRWKGKNPEKWENRAKKISRAHSGKTLHYSHREAISRSMRGRRLGEEQRRRISESMRHRKQSTKRFEMSKKLITGAFAFIVAALIIFNFTNLGLFAGEDWTNYWENRMDMTSDSNEQNITTHVVFGDHKPDACADGILVTTGVTNISFSIINDVYDNATGKCLETDVFFDNIIYQQYSGFEITFVQPTPEDGAVIYEDNFPVSVELSEAASLVLIEWTTDNVTSNDIMSGSDVSWSFNLTDLILGDYAYKIYVNTTSGSTYESLPRTVHITSPAPPTEIPEENATEAVPNETVSNETISNQTISNETISNDTEAVDNVTLPTEIPDENGTSDEVAPSEDKAVSALDESSNEEQPANETSVGYAVFTQTVTYQIYYGKLPPKHISSIEFVAPTPEDGALIGTDNVYFNVTLDSEANIAVLQWDKDDEMFNEIMGGFERNYVFNLTNLSEGVYSYRVIATGLDDKTFNTVSRTINVSFARAAEELIQGPAEINKSVTWTKKMRNLNGTVVTGIDGSAFNITVVKVEGASKLNVPEENVMIKDSGKLKSIKDYEKDKVNKRTLGEVPLTNDLQITNVTGDVDIEYETAAPTATEHAINDFRKIVEISSDVHYDNILAYTDIGEWDSKFVKVYHMTDSGKELVTDVTYIDSNNNSLVDRVEWVVPHLSNETYEVDITILNVQSYPTVGGNWAVDFTTTGIADLNITAVDGTIWNNTEETGDLLFLELRCGNDLFNYTWLNETGSVFATNYSCDDTGHETSRVLTAGVHNLQFCFGGDCQEAHNYASRENNTWVEFMKNNMNNATTDEPGPMSNRTLWYMPIQGQIVDGPSIANNTVYVAELVGERKVWAVNYRTGAAKWYSMGLSGLGTYSTYGALSYNNGDLFIGAQDDTNGRLEAYVYSLDAVTGDLNWYHKGTKNGGFVYPVTVGDGKVFAPTYELAENANGTLYILNSVTGAEVCRVSGTCDWITSKPVYNGTHVWFLCSYYGTQDKLYAVKASDCSSLCTSAAFGSGTTQAYLQTLGNNGSYMWVSHDDHYLRLFKMNDCTLTKTSASSILGMGRYGTVVYGEGSSGGVLVPTDYFTSGDANSLNMFNKDTLAVVWSSVYPGGITNVEPTQWPIVAGSTVYSGCWADCNSTYARSVSSGSYVWSFNYSKLYQGDDQVSAEDVATAPRGAAIDNGTMVTVGAKGIWGFGTENYPTQTAPVLNSSYGTNGEDENLTCYAQNVNDNDSDPVNLVYNWYGGVDSGEYANLILPFDVSNNPDYGETKDYSGYGTHAYLGNYKSTGDSAQPLFVQAGASGNAYYFDGSNDYINVSDESPYEVVSPLDLYDKWTIEAWIYPTQAPTSAEGVKDMISKSTSYYVGYGYNGRTDSGNLKVYSYGSCPIWTEASTALVYNNRWTHIAVQWNNSNTNVFINGTLVNSSTTSCNAGTGTTLSDYELRIGHVLGGVNRFFNGTIDEVRLYPWALTTSQIKEHAARDANNNPAPRYNTIVAGQGFVGSNTVAYQNQTKAGQKWRCEMTPNDGIMDGPIMRSSPLLIDHTPIQGTPSIGSSTTDKNSNLTCTNTSTSDPDARPIGTQRSIFNFYVNNAPVAALYLPFDLNNSNTTTYYGFKDFSGYGNDGTPSARISTATGMGTVSLGNPASLTSAWTFFPMGLAGLTVGYVDPVIITSSVSNTTSATDKPGVVRIRNVSSNGFWARVQEPPNLADTSHESDATYFGIFESGRNPMPDGFEFVASLNSTVGSVSPRLFPNQIWNNKSFQGRPFAIASYVVFSQVQSNYDNHFVKPRTTAVDSTGGTPYSFNFSLEEDRASNDLHGPEILGLVETVANTEDMLWCADACSCDNRYEVLLGSASSSQNPSLWTAFNQKYSDEASCGVHFGKRLAYLSSLGSYNDPTPAEANYNYTALNVSGVYQRVEEDTTLSPDTTHATESIPYFVTIEGSSAFLSTPPTVIKSFMPTLGYAVNFTNKNKYVQFIEIPNTPSMQISGNITLEAWVRNDITAGGTEYIIMERGSNVTKDSAVMNITTAGHYGCLFESNTGARVGVESSTSGGTVHLACVWNTTHAIIYVNGAVENVRATTGWTGLNPAPGGAPSNAPNFLPPRNLIGIGVNKSSTGTTSGRLSFNRFIGALDEVMISPRALSTSELQMHAKAIYNVTTFEETGVGDQWKCGVTPVDGETYGNQSNSSSTTIAFVNLKSGVISYSPVNPSNGTATHVNMSLINEGTGDAGAFTVVTMTDGAYANSTSVSGLSAGANAEVTYDWTARQQLHTIRFIIDSGGAVSETVENDNNASVTLGAEWPAESGDQQRIASSSYTGLPYRNTTRVLENVTTKDFTSGMAIAEDRIIVTSSDGYVYTYNATNGTAMNSFNTGGALNNTPVVFNGTIFVGSNSSRFYALDLNLNQKWVINKNCNFTAAAAIAHDQRTGEHYVIASCSDWTLSQTIVYALFTQNGTEKWNYNFVQGGDTVVSTPAVWNNKIYLTTGGGANYLLYEYDPNGTQVWNFQPNNGINSYLGYNAFHTIYNEMLYLPTFNITGTGYKHIRSFNVTSRTAILNKTFPTTSTRFMTPVLVANNTLYVGGSNMTVYALDKDTGNPKWTFSDGGLMNILKAPFAYGTSNGAGVLYVIDNSSVMYGIAAVNGTLLWKYNASLGSYQDHAGPAIAYNKVYFVTRKSGGSTIYAFNYSNNNVPTLTSVSANATYVKNGDGLLITTTGAADADGDALSLQCGDASGLGNLCIGAYGSPQRTCNFTVTWSDNIAHTIYCRVNDASSNSTPERTVSVTADNIAPNISLIRPPNNTNMTAAQKIYINISDSNVLTRAFYNVEPFSNTTITSPWGNITYVISAFGYQGGWNIFHVYAEDSVGNNADKTYRFYINDTGWNTLRQNNWRTSYSILNATSNYVRMKWAKVDYGYCGPPLSPWTGVGELNASSSGLEILELSCQENGAAGAGIVHVYNSTGSIVTTINLTALLPGSVWFRSLLFGGVIADVNNDEKNDIVFMSYNTTFAYDTNGTQLWNYTPYTDFVATFQAAPAVADINDDNINEVVVSDNRGNVTALSGINGTVLWNYLVVYGTTFSSPPTIAEINSTYAGKEIIVQPISISGVKLLMLNSTGQQIANVTWVASAGWDSATVADINNDTKPEVAELDYTSVASQELCLYNNTLQTEMWCLQLDLFGDIQYSGPAVADLLNDSGLEMVISSGIKTHVINSTGQIRYNISTGTWWSSPSLADINNDGIKEIILARQDGILSAYSPNGTNLWNYDWNASSGTQLGAQPSIVDLDADMEPEIVVMADWTPTGQTSTLIALDIGSDATSPTIRFVSPSNLSVMESGEFINVNVSDDFSVDKVWYRIGSGSNRTLTSPYYNSTYIINTVNIEDGNYTFYVYANDSAGNPALNTTYHQIKNSGWKTVRHYPTRTSMTYIPGNLTSAPKPTQIYPATDMVDSNVVVADTNRDGEFEAIFADGNAILFDYNVTTSRQRWNVSIGGGGFGTPWEVAVADMNNDGKYEIVTNSWTTFSSSYLSVIDSDGNVLLANGTWGQIQGLALADINDDGMVEIVYTGTFNPCIDGGGGTLCGGLVAINGTDGTALWTNDYSDYASGVSAYTRPAIADFNSTSAGLEIVVGMNGDSVMAFNSTGGTMWIYEPYLGNGGQPSSPTIADINNDTNLEIAYLVYQDESNNLPGNLSVLNNKGQLLWNATLGFGGPQYEAGPAIADINATLSGLELAITAPDIGQYGTSSLSLIVYNSTGGRIWNASMDFFMSVIDSEPFIFDANGDGRTDVIDGGTAYDGLNGSALWTTEYLFMGEGKQAIADGDGDNKAEIFSWWANSTNEYAIAMLDSSGGSPTISNVYINSTRNFTLDNLYCNGTYSDPDNDTETNSTFRWFENTSQTAYAVMINKTAKTLNSNYTKEGFRYICEYTPYDGFGAGTPVNSSAVNITPLTVAATYNSVPYGETGNVSVGSGGKLALGNFLNASAVYALTGGNITSTANITTWRVKLESNGNLTMDAVTAAKHTFLRFQDSSGTGIDGASAGTLIGKGSNAYRVNVTTTASGTPTNRWLADWDVTSLKVTADYTTFEKFGRFYLGQSDIDNCWFINAYNHPSGSMLWGTVATPLSFTNNTLIDGSYGIYVPLTYTAFDNLTISNTDNFAVGSNGGTVELNRSSFLYSKAYLYSASSHIISDNHNKIANQYDVWAGTAGLSKSAVTNDFTSAKNVTLRSGTFLINEAASATSFNVLSQGNMSLWGWNDLALTGTSSLEEGGNITLVKGNIYGLKLDDGRSTNATYNGTDVRIYNVYTAISAPSNSYTISKFVNATNMTPSGYTWLNITYTTGDLGSAVESRLKMWRYNAAWSQVPTTGVNVVIHYAWANVSNFSMFAPMDYDTVPTHSAPVLNATDIPNNRTSANLTCYNISTNDTEGDNVTNIYNWFKSNRSIMLLNMPFDSDDSRGTNTTKDYSGYGHHGMLGAVTDGDSAEPTWTPYGRVGGAYRFDGSDDYINVSDLDAAFNFSDRAYTVLFWANATYKSSGALMYKGARFDDNEAGFASFIMASSPAKLYALIGNGTNHLEYLTGLDTFAWTQFGMTRNSNGDVYYWQNGTSAYMGNIKGSVNSSRELWIGRSAVYSTTMNGAMDDLRIYNYTLSSTEIKQIYDDTKNGYSNRSVMTYDETTKGEDWRCEVTPNDGRVDGTARNSSNVTIQDTPPTLQAVLTEDSVLSPANQLDLAGGGKVLVFVNGTANDEDGWADLSTVTSTLYQRYVTNAGCSADYRNCYVNSSCVFDEVINATSRRSLCTHEMWFNAINTTLQGWNGNTTVTDGSGSSVWLNDTADVNKLIAVDVQNNITFGSMAPGDTSALDVNVSVRNWGNIKIDLALNGTNMTCTGYGSVDVSKIKYDCSAYGTAYASMTVLTGASTSASCTGFNLDRNETATGAIGSANKNLPWKINVPYTARGNCQGTVWVIGSSDS